MTLRRMPGRISNRTLARSLPQRVYGRVRGQLYHDFGGSTATLFLAGSPRSGTTWVAEMIVAGRNIRLVFEPFHSDEVPLAGGFGRWRYLRPSNHDAAAVASARRIIAGSIRSTWTDRFNRAVFPRQRLIKEVRANLLLGWLSAHVPNMPMALVMRHPLAVAASQQAVGWRFDAETQALLDQADLLEDHLGPLRSVFEDARTPAEQAVAMWCAENYVPLRQFGRGQIHIVCYEQLVARPEAEFDRLLSHYGLPYSRDLLHRIGRPSGVSARNSPIARGEDALRSWQAAFDGADRKRLLALLEPFGLDRVYRDDPMPLLDDPNQLLAQR